MAAILREHEYSKCRMQQNRRNLCDAAHRGDASALATLREKARKAAEWRRKRKVVQSRICQALPALVCMLSGLQ